MHPRASEGRFGPGSRLNPYLPFNSLLRGAVQPSTERTGSVCVLHWVVLASIYLIEFVLIPQSAAELPRRCRAPRPSASVTG